MSLAATAVIAVTAAAAGATWTFLPGGNVTATNSGNLTAKDNATGVAATCSKATAVATAKSGSGMAPDDLVSLVSISFSSPGNPSSWCTGPAGIYVSISAQGLPWKFTAESYDATTRTAFGKMKGVIVSMVGTDGCHATFGAPGGGGGEIGLSYANGSGTLKVTSSTLVATSVDANCDPTALNVGDPLGVTATFTVSPRQTVTSP
ncbi:hypothetical protein [Actinomadura rupiterrae]|uniref:hypothetical protein n=1 Tax=Actinomadura rupiterrae TaxID=559627 RepID=UPI0020A4F93B|nr:hypothetical protein [Actinomadura rupiterrae]MCP2334821.1 hypothetical protein [Actinomadura rupiterrae]